MGQISTLPVAGTLTGAELLVVDQPNTSSSTGFLTCQVNTQLYANLIKSQLVTANPTGLVGLTAVNGVATSVMRSDAAPALDVTISPTWTGIHTYTHAAPQIVLGVNAGAGGQINLNGATSGTGIISVAATGGGITVGKVTLTPPATGSTLTIADGKTFTVNNTLTLSGTDATVMTFPTATDTVVGLAAAQTLTNKTLTSPVIASISGNSGATGTLSSGTGGGTGGQLTFNGATSGSVALSTPATGGAVNHNAAIATPAPVTTASATPTVTTANPSVIFNPAGAATVTMPAAATFLGAWLYFKLVAAQAVTSGASNIVPLAGGAAGTTIFSANTAGKFTWLQSDGTNWIIMAQN